MRRWLLGFLVAPLATPPALAALFLLGWMTQIGWFRGKDLPSVFNGTLGFTLPAIVLAYAVVLLGALPTYLVLRRRRSLRVGDCLLAGAMLGVLPFLLFDLFVAAAEIWQALRSGWTRESFGILATARRLIADVPDALPWLVCGVVSGLASSFVFYRIAVRPSASLEAAKLAVEEIP
jgi:hypothetical protein